MDDPGAELIALKLIDAMKQLDYKLGEQAEVRKAQLQAEHDGFVGGNVTEARQNSKFNAIEHTKELYDLEADITSLTSWVQIYRLLLEKNVYIPLAGLPPSA